jgi:2'-5' RNA ligase
MPIGIVATLPEPFDTSVRTIWHDLEREFGVKNSAEATPPHITLHVAEMYRRQALQTALTKWAKTATPCPIRTWGIGVFSGTQPIVFIGVTRTQELSALHDSIFSLSQMYSVNHVPIFEPFTWEPHITLAHEGVSAENIGSIVAYLNQHAITWEFPITSLSLIEAQHNETVICHTVTL